MDERLPDDGAPIPTVNMDLLRIHDRLGPLLKYLRAQFRAVDEKAREDSEFRKHVAAVDFSIIDAALGLHASRYANSLNCCEGPSLKKIFPDADYAVKDGGDGIISCGAFNEEDEGGGMFSGAVWDRKTGRVFIGSTIAKNGLFYFPKALVVSADGKALDIVSVGKTVPSLDGVVSGMHYCPLYKRDGRRVVLFASFDPNMETGGEKFRF